MLLLNVTKQYVIYIEPQLFSHVSNSIFHENTSHKVNILVITEIPKLAFFTANRTWNLFHLACPALDHPGDEQGGEDVDGGGEESRDDAGGEEGQNGTACSLEKTRPENEKLFICLHLHFTAQA